MLLQLIVDTIYLPTLLLWSEHIEKYRFLLIELCNKKSTLVFRKKSFTFFAPFLYENWLWWNLQHSYHPPSFCLFHHLSDVLMSGHLIAQNSTNLKPVSSRSSTILLLLSTSTWYSAHARAKLIHKSRQMGSFVLEVNPSYLFLISSIDLPKWLTGVKSLG